MSTPASTTRAPGTALVVGATGISGQALCSQLVADGWTTYGLSRHDSLPVDGVTPIAADLLDPGRLSERLRDVRPDVVFLVAWMKQDTEKENIEVNSRLLRNVFTALEPAGSVRHVALMTGLKHYLGPFEDYGTAVTAETPFHESEPRLDNDNFYYAQEDEVFAAAERMGFTWSVHRAHTIVGFAVGNAMNMALTLSVYATLCREHDRPFVFPGSETQWNGLTDVTDVGLLAEQMIWPRRTPRARTNRSTSPTATSSGGAGCGRRSRSTSVSTPSASTASRSRWTTAWATRPMSGARSRRSTTSSSPT